MEFTIRRADSVETDILTDLSLRSKRSNGYDDAFMAACVEELTVTNKRMSEGEYWVAEHAGAVCGCVCLTFDVAEKTSAEINAFFIDPDKKRMGVGRLLWAKIRERAAFHGITHLELDADPFAVPFYNSMGFDTIGETPSESIPNRVLPRMAIELA